MQQPINIKSEIGKLKTVILHRPGEELEGLTPDYMERMLFDDVPYLKVAQEEHDAFAQVLRDNGVEVLYLVDLVAEALATDEIKWQFAREMVRASKQGGRATTDALISYLGNMPAKEMVAKIIAGVRKHEVTVPDPKERQLHHYLIDEYPFYMDPMPNMYFQRDPAAAIGYGITVNKMHWPARRRESLFMDYILRYHPRFANANIPRYFDRNSRFSMEGGDELVLNSKTVAIGISERTEAEAIEELTINLFKNSDFEKVLAIEIPSKRAFMHLDTVFTMVDYDKFSIHPAIRKLGEGDMKIFELTKANTKTGYFVTQEIGLQKTLEEALQRNIQFIDCGAGDVIASAREQWNDGSNTLAIAPGVVVTYDRNYVTNAELRKAGVKVIEVPGAEVGRGRGGPRCMSMPIVREEIKN